MASQVLAFVISLVFMGVSVQAAPMCHDLYRDLEILGSNFKNEVVEQLKQGKILDPEKFNSIQDKVDFFEAVADYNGWDVLTVDNALKYGTEKQKQKIRAALNKINFNQKIDPYRFQKQVEYLYRLTNPEPFPLSLSLKQSRERFLQTRIENVFLKQSLTDAIKTLGLVKEKSNLNKIRSLREKYYNIEKTVLSATFNLVSFLSSGLPSFLPSYKFGARLEIPEAVFLKIKYFGIDSAREDLANIFKQSSRQQFNWNLFIGIYNKVNYGVALVYVMQVAPGIKAEFSHFRSAKESLEQVAKESIRPEVIKNQLLETWRKDFKTKNNREPTIEEIRIQYDKIKLIPDDQLIYKLEFK